MTEKTNPEDALTKTVAEPDDSPKFGRLLIVLVLAVMLIACITFLSEALYS